MIDNEEARFSFSREKVGQFQKGKTGITGTSEHAIKPIASAEMDEDGNFNSSDLLFKNIDKMGENMRNTRPESASDGWPLINAIDDMTEEDAIKDLDNHLQNIRKETKFPNIKINAKPERARYCRNCGIPYDKIDNFCANCGMERKSI